MNVFKIPKKYCTQEKVQMFCNFSDEQIIFSYDEWLYLRKGVTIVDKYETEPLKGVMQCIEKSEANSSRFYVRQFYKYNTVYVKFASCLKSVSYNFDEDAYALSFLYFIREKSGAAVGVEMYLCDFNTKSNTLHGLEQKDVEAFFYDISNVGAKYVFDWSNGIRYARFRDEPSYVMRDIIDFSRNGIVKKYNTYQQARSRIKNVDFQKITSINQINQEFSMTSGGTYCDVYPLMIITSGVEMEVAEFDVIYCKQNEYKIRILNRKIVPDVKKIMDMAKNAHNITK